MIVTTVRRSWVSAALVALLCLSCGDDASPDAGSDGGDDGGETDAGDGGESADAGPDAFDAGPPPECGNDTPLALSACVDEARYREDLVFTAAEREPGSDHWMAVQDRCAAAFDELGFEVERHAYDTGVNVIGVSTGDSEPGRRVLVGAHYDHIAGCEGADDNATGVAGVLEAARVLSRRSYPRTLVVACWDEEERGLVGSTAYAEREVSAGRSFDIHFNFEMIGYFDDSPGAQELPVGFDLLFPDVADRVEANDNRGDFIAAIGNEPSAPFLEAFGLASSRHGLRAEPLEVPDSVIGEPLAADLRRSDHDPFWQRDIPAIMITDTSEFRYDAYHCREGEDTVDRLDTGFASDVVAATVASAAEALGLSR